MKNKLLIPAIFSLVAFVLLSYAFTGDKERTRDIVNESGAVVGAEQFAPGGIYTVIVTADTLTNTEKDTISFSDNIASLYTYCFQPVITQLSGTASVKVYLDQSTASSGTTDWTAIDSTASLTNAAPRGILDGTDLLGYRYRLRFVGSGTASVRYTCTGRLKRKN